MGKKVLELVGISKSFPGVKALDKINLNIYEGRVMALLGENGAGKSTLMKVMTGIHKMDEGEIRLYGKKEIFTSPKESQDKGIAIIHQELNLIPNISIGENIFLGREFTKGSRIDWKKIYNEGDKYLSKLGVKYSSKELLGNLSVGEQQMVEVAKALSQDANIIVMDEPTDALTDEETKNLFKVIETLKEEGKSIVYISHRLKEIFEICDDITVMRDGKFICEEEVKNIDENFIIEKMVGRKLEDQFPQVEVEKGDKALEVNSLNGEYVKDITFDLHKGEILGVAGLMGAGRTELAKTIYGEYKVRSGEIKIHGKKVSINGTTDGLLNGISYVSEDRKKNGLVLSLSVQENMSISSLDLFTNKGGRIRKGDEIEKVEEYIKKFNIKTPGMDQIIKNLSGGNQQKVAIAKALMSNPKVLILDEPTRGVDVGAKKEIYDLINELKEEGLGIILISSEMPEVIGLSDRIMVIHENKIGGFIDRDDVTQEKIMKYAVGAREEVDG